MKLFKNILDSVKPHFLKGGRLEKKIVSFSAYLNFISLIICQNSLAKFYTVAKDEQLYLKIQDVLLTNLDEVTNSRFQIDDVHHQGRAMLQGIS